jgi:hypothetical protein
MPRIANTAVLDATILRLAESDQPLTKQALGLSDYYIGKLAKIEKPLVTVKATAKVVNAETGEPDRGHPANLYGLTKRGRDKARRLRQKAERNAAPVAETATAE